jgi:hypothetical protein
MSCGNGMNHKRQVTASLLAIRKQARRIQNGKSYFDANAHAEAIVALVNYGLKAANKIRVARIGSNANMGCENES